MSLVKRLRNIKHPVGTKVKKGSTLGSIVNTSIKKSGRGARKQKRGKPPMFRSGFEREFWLANYKTIPLKYEPFRITYSVVEEKTYLPDFVYTDPYLKTNKHTVYETKGHWLPRDRKKILYVKKSNPGLRIVMVFMRDNYLTKAKKARYSDWCIKNQIDYCIGTDLSKIVHASNPNRTNKGSDE
jgi:hypothetical protein